MNHTSCQFRGNHTVGGIVFYKHAFLVLFVFYCVCILLCLLFDDEIIFALNVFGIF